jgi:histone-lysine N-methyltransferase SUV39H
LAKFLKPGQFLPSTLKRKSPHDSVGNGGGGGGGGFPKVISNGTYKPASDEIFAVKNEETSPLSFFGNGSDASSRGSSVSFSKKEQQRRASRSLDPPKKQASSRDSSNQAQRKRASNSEDEIRAPPSASAAPPAKYFPAVSVVVPAPTPKNKVFLSMKKSPRKIKRMSSASLESSGEESDPDKPIGLKTKYYPLDLDKVRAAKGRYPQVRTTAAQHVAVTPFHRPGNVRSAQSKLFYLRENLDRRLRAIKGPPVIMAGEWNGTSLASNFEFINTYKLQKGVTRVPDEFNAGCGCGPYCDPARCTCLSQEEDTEERMVAYERKNRQPVLKDSFISKKTMIYECNSYCGCGKDCWNRLVQHGRTVRLEIFQTGSRGFGLRSPDPIVRGQFIDCYLGEVITSAEADLREDAASSKNSPSYLFSLDFIHMDDEDPYVVDGKRLGGPSRFMNHSCNPNCKMFTVSTHHGDSRIYDLAFFALRDIPSGTELTFDYNPDWNGDRNEDPNAVKCLCGESQCRGQLWPNQRKSTKDD